VRRSLEDDPRFSVVGRTRVAPPVTITRGAAGPLSVAAIGDAAVVVVTAPHTLGAADVDLLDRFVTERGGSLMVVPDRRPSGPALRLFPRVASQQRDAQPREVGRLRVREWLTFDPGAGTTTLAALAGDPVVMSTAVGRGRVIVSGALDAWRFREAASGFNSFWTNVAWEAATAAGKPLHLTAEQVLARPGEPIRIEAVRQTIERPLRQLSASGSITCGDQRRAVRMWPGGRPSTFEGTVRPTRAGRCELSVTIGDRSATLPLAVQQEVRRGRAPHDALEAAIEAHGGIVVEPGDGESRLVARAVEQLPAPVVTEPAWPMRSPYWLVILAGSLIGEWWLRRRAGLS
jgi:hypothetical protein